MMRYLDICSGISAPTVGWRDLGFTCAGYSEIEAAPRSVLIAQHGATAVDWDHRHTAGSNVTPLFGDFTQIEAHHVGPIDLLVGGTPCQSFSIAGLRGGMADERGNLALEYLRLADRLRPRWLVWENVPGVLSSNGGRDFGSILGGMGELGYGFAYRILDAQFFGVPQRRRRVFVVGYLGDWRRAAAVLFERHSLQGNLAPRRETGESVAPTISARTKGGGGLGTDFDCDGGLIASTGNVAHCLNAGGMGRQDYETETLIAHSLRGEGFDASEDGTGRGTPLVPVCYDTTNLTSPGNWSNPQPHDTANIRAASGGSSRSYVAQTWAVRRLTPRECERLQGFPDDFTLVEHRKKPMADGPRYKALGNSMAAPVLRWIGERIVMVENMARDESEAA